MVSLDTLLLCSACLTLFLALFFFYQNQGFCSHKIALIKKRVYIYNSKRILFSVFFSIRKSIPPTVWVERKRFHFVHQKIISLWTSYCTIKNGSRNPLNSKIAIYDDSEWPKALNHCHKETHFWCGKASGSTFGFY